MAKLATESSNWIHVSEWETQQEGWSRTAVSLKFVKVKHLSNVLLIFYYKFILFK